MTEEEEKKETMNILAMVTELYIAECRAQDLLLADNSKYIHQEIKREFKFMFGHLRKIVSKLQSKFKDVDVFEQNNLANDMEKMNNLMVLSSGEQREYIINIFLDKLENDNRRTHRELQSCTE